MLENVFFIVVSNIIYSSVFLLDFLSESFNEFFVFLLLVAIFIYLPTIVVVSQFIPIHSYSVVVNLNKH